MRIDTYERIRLIATFAAEFGRYPLYDTGFCEPMRHSGLSTADAEDLGACLRKIAYVHGYADACRLANEYMSPQWEICHLIGIAMGTFRVMFEADDPASKFAGVIDTYHRKLAALLAKKDEARGLP